MISRVLDTWLMRAVRPAALGAMLALAGTLGCERIQPIRTLPAWVRGVYVPMIRNQSYETGVEEEATKLIQETFLNDGRLDIVPKKNADLTIKVAILEWNVRASGTGGDHIADQTETTLLTSVQLFDPSDDTVPLADLGKLRMIVNSNTELRSTLYKPEPDRIHDILEQLARQVVNKTIEGFPTSLRALPGQPLPTIPTSTTDVHSGDVLKSRQSEDR